MFEHERLLKNHLSVNRSLMKNLIKTIFLTTILTIFKAFLANFNSSGNFKVCSKAPFSDNLCHVEVTHLTFNESQLTGFNKMRVFTERRLRADFHFSPNVNVNVTVVSYMNSTSRETILHNFLQQWIDLNIFRTMKPESTSKAALFETNSQILLSFIFFFYIFLKHKRDMRLTYLLIVSIFLQIHPDWPSRQKNTLENKSF